VTAFGVKERKEEGRGFESPKGAVIIG